MNRFREYYERNIRTGTTEKERGLCFDFMDCRNVIYIFMPELHNEESEKMYWLGTPGEFSELRQNVILFLSVMSNEEIEEAITSLPLSPFYRAWAGYRTDRIS